MPVCDIVCICLCIVVCTECSPTPALFKCFILRTLLIPLTALISPTTIYARTHAHTHTHTHTHTHHTTWADCCEHASPHHIHIITQQLILFPKSQYLGLNWDNPIGAAHFSICFSIQESTVLQTPFVFFKPAFPMFSPANHPLNPCTPSIINNVSRLL